MVWRAHIVARPVSSILSRRGDLTHSCFVDTSRKELVDRIRYRWEPHLYSLNEWPFSAMVISGLSIRIVSGKSQAF